MALGITALISGPLIGLVSTWLLEAGEHLYVVAERLGHTDPQTTSSIYAHVSPDQRSSVANVFARVRDGIQ